MGKMRGTHAMGHGPGRTRMRGTGSTMRMTGARPGRASISKVNASLNRGVGGEEYVGSGIARSGVKVGGTVPVKVSNVQLGNS